MTSFISLNSLNYAAASFHGIQALIVIILIVGYPNSKPNTPSLMNGIYSLQRNLLVLRSPDTQPHCTLPHLNATRSALLTLKFDDAMSVEINSSSISQQPTMMIYQFNENAFAMQHNFFTGYINVQYLIFSFFLLSFLFQMMDGLGGTYSSSHNGPRLLRFLEYSFSASIMIMAISLQVGMTDIYSLCYIFTLVFATNMLGMIAELLFYIVEKSADLQSNAAFDFLMIHPKWWWLIPHLLGWVTCIVAYAPLLDSYLTSALCSDLSPPGFVNVIVFLEFFLFICFGIVQFYALYMKSLLLGENDPAVRSLFVRYVEVGGRLRQAPASYMQHITDQGDWAYIILSFTAKTLLAWLILSPTILNRT